jgi:hypothetical protein
MKFNSQQKATFFAFFSTAPLMTSIGVYKSALFYNEFLKITKMIKFRKPLKLFGKREKKQKDLKMSKFSRKYLEGVV